MSMKFFSNIQDFLHLYNPAPLAPNVNGTPSSNNNGVDLSSPSANSNQQNFLSIENLNNNDSNDNVIESRRKTFSNSKDSASVYYCSGPSASTDYKGILRPSSSYSNVGEADGNLKNGFLPATSLDSINADGVKKRKSVQFPVDDNLVTGFLEPRKPCFLRRKFSSEDVNFLNLHEMLEAYLNACKKFKVTPSAKVEKQISTLHMVRGERQEILSLRGEKLTHTHMDCLEEIFKRVQFNTVDFEYCFLDDEALISLSDMLEFYDSAIRLNLSFNQNIGLRGWQAFFRMIRKSTCLEHLNLRYTSLNERTVPLLARTLRAESSLVSLHLENCSLSGKSMLLLACAFKTNTSIRDLYFAENNLTPSDATHLYQIIAANTTIELLDLRNNQLQDAGLAHICDALKNPDVQGKSKLNTLVLWNNRLTAQGMIHLARALLENKTLKTLNLGMNNIGSEGVSIIKDSLARNRTMLRLGLQATKLNCQGAIAVAECIADNPMLIRVDLRDNPDIKSAGLLALHVALRMNTSILALNLDKSCAQTSSLKSKEHGDHFKKLYDEIHTFCRRNHDLMVEKLNKEEEKQLLTSKESTPDEQISAVMQEEQEIHGSVAVSKISVPVSDCPEENMSRLNLRKISLTCKESVENLCERFQSMPRVEEMEEPPPKDALVKQEPSVAVIANVPSAAAAAAAAADEPNVSAAPSAGAQHVLNSVAVAAAAKIQQRPNTLPVMPAAPRPGPRRFSVSKVDSMKKQENNSASISAALSPARRVTIDYLPPDHDESKDIAVIRRILSDMVNFCAYEAGELANTPCVPAASQFLPVDCVEKQDADPPVSSFNLLPTSVQVDCLPHTDVVQLMDDLVRFVDYETKGGITYSGNNKNNAAKKSKIQSSSSSATSIDKTVAASSFAYSRNSNDDSTEISLAVREVVRDLVKNVCVQFDRKTAGRSSLLLRNRIKKQC